MIKNIMICGAGLMGRGIAQVFAACEDLSITLYDVRENDTLGKIAESMKMFIERGAFLEEEAKARLSRMRFTTSLKDEGVKNADMVVEAVFEDMALKQDTFVKLEEACRTDCIFATNTSVMSPSEISAKIKHRERFVGMHFWNPAHLIPLVEVVMTDATAEEIAQQTLDILNRAGKKAVLCRKDVPGFIANRMQQALWREAASIVGRGICDAETVDIAVKYSFGLRLPQLGPCENMDMVGLDLAYNIHDYIFEYIEDSHRPAPLLAKLKEEGKLGFKSGGGFYKWTPEQQAKSHHDLSEFLLNLLFGSTEP